MKVIIVRHAETSENAKQIDIGHNVDPFLTKEGILQAQKLGEYLKSEKIHYAYVSPQKRAVHTAEQVLKHHPVAQIAHVPHLKEQNLGIYESLPKHEWKKIKKEFNGPFHLFKPPKGESYVELQQRVKDFFHTLFDKHKNDTILIVSHAGTLVMLYLHLLGKEITEENYNAHKPQNTAFTILEVTDDEPLKVHKINSIEHLS